MGLRVPPRHLVEAAKRIDPTLEFIWGDQIGRDGSGRWTLGRYTHDRMSLPDDGQRCPGLPTNFKVMRILEDTNTGLMVELTQKTIEEIAWGDPWRRPNGGLDIIDEIQSQNDAKRRADEQSRQDTLDWMEKDIRKAARAPVRIDFSRSKK